MGEYAPEALKYYAREAVAKVGGQLSGIVGDSAHTYGYHRARNVLPGSDYSVTLPLDRLGDGDAASAVDWSLPADKMKLVTSRLKAAALHPDDDRLDVLREFYGTLDGNNVYGLTHNGYGQAWDFASSDDSHLWHVHHSFFRKHSGDMDAAKRVLSVVTGQSWEDWKAHGYSGSSPGPAPAPAPAPGSMSFPLPAGHYFGDINGPNESHGGHESAPASDRVYIKDIQNKLIDLGFAGTTDRSWADGLYEQPTIDAVKKFQAANGLSVDGKVGPATWAKLFPASSKTYTVKAGDTLTKIAKANGVTILSILALNNISDANKIRVGQVLKLPGSAPAPQPTPTPKPAPTGGTLRVAFVDNSVMDSVANKLKKYLEKSLPADLLSKLYITSAHRGSSGVDYHEDMGSNGALDVAAQMTDAGQRAMQAASRLIMRDKDLFLEVIHTTPFSDDNGFYVKNGREVGPGFYGAATEAAHLNHIHLATSESMGDQLINRY